MDGATAIEVREAVDGDTAELAALVAEFDGGEPDPAGVRRRLGHVRSTDLILVAPAEGGAAGFCSVHFRPWVSGDAPSAELTELYVRSKWRRRGVGRALMARAEAGAASRGCHELLLVTGLHNAGAQAFYRALGYTEHAVGMRKRPL